MFTITVCSQKGGSGKTSTSLALASGLIRSGSKVLLVDLDAQGSLTSTITTSTRGATVADLIQNKAKAEDVIIKSKTGYADLIPANSLLANDVFKDISDYERNFRLREGLVSVKDQYDVCILDCPPALGTMIVNALTASDGVILTVTTDRYALDGIDQFMYSYNSAKKYTNPNLKLLGYVVGRFNGRSILSKEGLQMLEESAKQNGTKILGVPVRECISVREAQMMYNPDLFDYSPRCNAALDFQACIDDIKELIK